MREIDCFSELPICLSIELIRSNEHSPIFFTRSEYDQISGYSLVWFNFDNLPHFQILTHNIFSPCFLNESVDLAIILLIPFFPIVIVISFLEKCKTQHKREGRNISEHKTNFKHIDELTQSDDQEKQVKEESELVV